MYDRHDRPSPHRLVPETVDLVRTLHADVRAGLWEGAGRLAVAGANVLVNGAITLGSSGRRMQEIAVGLAPEPHSSWRRRATDFEAAQRAAAMRRHPSGQHRSA